VGVCFCLCLCFFVCVCVCVCVCFGVGGSARARARARLCARAHACVHARARVRVVGRAAAPLGGCNAPIPELSKFTMSRASCATTRVRIVAGPALKLWTFLQPALLSPSALKKHREQPACQRFRPPHAQALCEIFADLHRMNQCVSHSWRPFAGAHEHSHIGAATHANSSHSHIAGRALR
jgi:hypothetical protein